LAYLSPPFPARVAVKLKGGAKKGPKKVRGKRAPSTPVVETVVVDVVEEPMPGVAVVTEIEATEVREVSGAPAQPEERPTLPGSEES
jgi:hypothetical protein